MLLIYTHKITPRLTYAFKHIFTRILDIPISFTTKIEDFIAHDQLKITYTKQALQNEFFIRSYELLFEQGIGDVEINVQNWEGTPCFFPANNDKSALPFDIFATSFYLLSRYEEYVPHVKDEHGRYPVTESLAYKHKFLENPVVDVWAYKLLDALKKRFPEAEFRNSVFTFMPIVNVPIAYAYRKLGIMRTVGGTLRDLFNLKLGWVWQRYKVLFGFGKDPYDTFGDFIGLHETYGVNAIYFFLFAKYATHDNNISVYSNSFRALIKSVSDHSITSLMVSYAAFSDIDILKRERNRLSDLIHRPILRVRQHYNRISFPDSYRNLLDAEIMEDFTMGYHDHIGFRAGTCTPFYFYDIGMELQTPLKVTPVAATDNALKGFGRSEEVLKKINELGDRVKSLNGTFILSLHNYTINETDTAWKGWREIYIQILNKYGNEGTGN